jgi:hypothetical protein
MKNGANARVRAIRSRAQKERTLISELNALVKFASFGRDCTLSFIVRI